MLVKCETYRWMQLTSINTFFSDSEHFVPGLT